MLQVLLEEDLVFSLFFVLFFALLQHLVELGREQGVGALQLDAVESVGVFTFIIAELLLLSVECFLFTFFQYGSWNQNIIVGTLSDGGKVGFLSLMLVSVLH